jgi:hypothetical protein
MADGEPQVARERLQPSRSACVARLLLERGDVAELARRLEPGLFWRHAPLDQALGGALDVVAHFDLHLGFESAAAEEAAEQGLEAAERHAHGSH